MISAAPQKPPRDLKRLIAHCHAYKGADTRRSIIQAATTALLFFSALSLMLTAFYHHAYWIDAVLVLPSAGLLIRLFIVQHDCGHGSFFNSRLANDVAGRLISILTFTPYDLWKKTHNMHHAGSGNLDRRGAGSIDTLTVREYRALSARQRFVYRLYRHPAFLLLLGPPLYVLFCQRFPPVQSLPYLKDYHSVPVSQAWRSVMSLNIFILLFYGAAMMIFGVKAVLAVYLPVLLTAFWAGQWLFFVQHQFEDAYWEHHESWNFSEAALLGSSYYALPRLLQWFTGNIGFHHIHHLCASIPNYRLQECFDGDRELSAIAGRMTFLQSLKCLRGALWDEDRSKMVSFAAAHLS